MHRLEVLFNRTFTLEECENLKDAIFEFLREYQEETKIEVLKELDLIVLDA